LGKCYIDLKPDSLNKTIKVKPASDPWQFCVKHSQEALNFGRGRFAVDSKNAGGVISSQIICRAFSVEPRNARAGFEKTPI
jgi:hypothetical protein